MKHNLGFETLCKAARQTVTTCSVDDVKKLLDNQQLPLLIDVREESEWNHDHLPHAVHLGRGIIERDIETLVPNKETTIILYCGGGYRGWKEAGYALVKD